jgi:hypothetical protein
MPYFFGKKMKKTRTIIMASVLISISGLTGFISAQQVYDIPAIDTLFEQKLAGQKIHLYPVNIIGSYFLNDEWGSGDIHLITGNWVKNKQLKYNSFTDELIWLRPLDYSMILLEKEQILEFNIKVTGNQKSMQFKKMDLNRTDSTKKFYQVLYEGRYDLYCNRRVINVEDATRKVDYATYSIPILKKAPVYIILSRSGELMTLEKINNRALLKSYPHDKDILKNLLRDKHLHLKTEEDLITVVKAIEENNLLY